MGMHLFPQQLPHQSQEITISKPPTPTCIRGLKTGRPETAAPGALETALRSPSWQSCGRVLGPPPAAAKAGPARPPAATYHHQWGCPIQLHFPWLVLLELLLPPPKLSLPSSRSAQDGMSLLVLVLLLLVVVLLRRRRREPPSCVSLAGVVSASTAHNCTQLHATAHMHHACLHGTVN
jgi:uncharacterized protein (TIGR03382 family)